MQHRLLAVAILVLASLFATAAARAQPARRPAQYSLALADDWSYGHAGVPLPMGEAPGLRPRGGAGDPVYPRLYAQRQDAPSRASILPGPTPGSSKRPPITSATFPRVQDLRRGAGSAWLLRGHDAERLGSGVARGRRRQAAADGRPPVQQAAGPRRPHRTSATTTMPQLRGLSQRRAPQQPWCFWYGSVEPHRGYEYGSGVAKGGKKLSDIDRVPGCWPDNEFVRNDLLDYAFEVEHYDRHLGRMLALLEKRGMLDNTLVVVTSDNGMPFPHDKGQAYHDSNSARFPYLSFPASYFFSFGIKCRFCDDVSVAGLTFKT